MVYDSPAKILLFAVESRMISNLCSDINIEFENLKNEILILNPYATFYRYPDNELLPTKNDVIEAIKSAEKVMEFVKIQLAHN